MLDITGKAEWLYGSSLAYGKENQFLEGLH